LFDGPIVLFESGYSVVKSPAAVRPGAWMKALEATNIAMAFVVVAVLVALFTPLADPRRLSVNDQVARLESGKVKVEAFDYEFLRFGAGRYGKDALGRLKASPNAEIAKRAKAAAAQVSRIYRAEPAQPAPPPRIAFHPKGARPPEGFLNPTLDGPRYGGCLSGADCDALVLDITGDGRPEVLASSGWAIEVYGPGADGVWRKVGSFQPPCSGFDSRAAIREGRLSAAAPAVQDLVSPQGVMRFEKDLDACPPVDRK
jgi:hypothetical protein